MGERRLLIALVLAAALLFPAAVAWACTPAANISARPASAPSGARVKVSGREFLRGPVEIRWMSQAESLAGAGAGRLLGRRAGPSFSLRVTVPRGRPGIYLLVAVARGEDGHVYRAVRPFRVIRSRASRK